MITISKPKIAVIGAGAVGSLIGGLLSRAGENVTLIGNHAHVKAINAKGLKIDGVAGSFTERIKADETLNFQPDIVFIGVKNAGVAKTCHEIKPFINNIPIVMLQNGITSAELAASIFSKTNIIGCTLMLNARFLSPGMVTYVNDNPTVIGKAFVNNDSSVKQVQTLLSKVAKTKISDAIIGVQWTKLLINSMSNSLDGMTGLNLGDYIQYPEMRRIGIRILKEALRLINKSGIQLEPLPNIPLSFFKIMIRLPTSIGMQILKLTAKARGDEEIITSTLQSLLKGKKTEIDYLNGEFVRLGQKLSIPTPVNSKVIELIHKIEKTQRFFSPAELHQEFKI